MGFWKNPRSIRIEEILVGNVSIQAGNPLPTDARLTGASVTLSASVNITQIGGSNVGNDNPLPSSDVSQYSFLNLNSALLGPGTPFMVNAGAGIVARLLIGVPAGGGIVYLVDQAAASYPPLVGASVIGAFQAAAAFDYELMVRIQQGLVAMASVAMPNFSVIFKDL